MNTPKPSYRDLVRSINSAYSVLRVRELREKYLLAELRKLAPDHEVFKLLSKGEGIANADEKGNVPVQPIGTGELSRSGTVDELGTQNMQPGKADPETGVVGNAAGGRPDDLSVQPPDNNNVDNTR